jgi:hypothetical protein
MNRLPRNSFTGENSSILNFTSTPNQTQLVSDTQIAGTTPANSMPTENSTMNGVTLNMSE